MLADRRFMTRVVGHLAAQGIRQFLDIGTGLPTHPNLHETVQGVVPDADVVYVDNDPLVLSHARALLIPVPGAEGTVSYLDTDLRDPAALFAAPQVADTFDRGEPIAVLMIAVLQLFGDLEPIDPGVVPVHRWRPDEREAGIEDREIGMFGGVAVKPWRGRPAPAAARSAPPGR
jgi:hypothetical protein